MRVRWEHPSRGRGKLGCTFWWMFWRICNDWEYPRGYLGALSLLERHRTNVGTHTHVYLDY